MVSFPSGVTGFGGTLFAEARDPELGHACIEAERDEKRIAISTSHTPTHAVIKIADNGIGVPPEIIDKIFQPFFTTKPAGVGTGLGLSLCQSLIDGMGGSMGIESELGVGTVMSVLMPLAEPVDTVVDTESEEGGANFSKI